MGGEAGHKGARVRKQGVIRDRANRDEGGGSRREMRGGKRGRVYKEWGRKGGRGRIREIRSL